MKTTLHRHVDEVIHRYMPPAMAEASIATIKGVKLAERESMEGAGGMWEDWKQNILLVEEDVPDWVVLHESLHAYVDSKSPHPLPEYPVIPDVPLLRAWAKATGDEVNMADVDDGELSEDTEEYFVQDLTSYLCAGKFPKVATDTPVSKEVEETFRRRLGEPPILTRKAMTSGSEG